jgi:chromosome partitioning protein
MPAFAQTTVARLAADLEVLRQQGFRLAVIDTPPAITMAIQSVIQVAELIVIPTRPSPHDLRAVGATVDLCERAGKPLIFVVNARRPRPRSPTRPRSPCRSTAPSPRSRSTTAPISPPR